MKGSLYFITINFYCMMVTPSTVSSVSSVTTVLEARDGAGENILISISCAISLL